MRRSTNRLRWAMMFQLLEVRQIHSFQGTTLYSCKHEDTLKIDAWKMKFQHGHSWSPFSGAVWYVSFRVFGPLGCHCVSFPEVRSFFRSWSCHWYFLMEKIMDHLGRTVKRSLYSNSMYYNCFFLDLWTINGMYFCSMLLGGTVPIRIPTLMSLMTVKSMRPCWRSLEEPEWENQINTRIRVHDW